MKRTIQELLYRSYDTELSAGEQTRLDKALADSPSLRRERDEIAALRDAASSSATPGFGPFFADRVMAAVESEAATVSDMPLFADLLTIFKPVAVAALLVLAVLIPIGGRTLIESLAADNQSLTSAAQSAYALDLEDMLCQTE